MNQLYKQFLLAVALVLLSYGSLFAQDDQAEIIVPKETVIVCINEPIDLQFYGGGEAMGLWFEGYGPGNEPFGVTYGEYFRLTADHVSEFAGEEDLGTYSLILVAGYPGERVSATVAVKVVDCSTSPWAHDFDEDGFGGPPYNNNYKYTATGYPDVQVSYPTLVNNNQDCNDNDSTVYPGAGAGKDCSGGQGLAYKYYQGNWSMLPDFNTLTAVKEGSVANFTLEPRSQNDYFGFVYSGNIDIATAGNYTFYTRSDDGSSLFINGQQVVNNDGLHGARERSGSVSLTAGKHAIEVRYFERTGTGENLQVSWAGPGIAKQVIPDAVLSSGSSTPTNQPPVAHAGPDVTVPLPRNHARVVGWGSDPDGPIASYQWLQLSGPTRVFAGGKVDGSTFHAGHLQQGTYEFEFTVTDYWGAAGKDTMKVVVTPPVQGISYLYYHGDWTRLPSFKDLTPESAGEIADFSISPRTQNDFFGFVFQGYIYISTPGTYRFYTKSDDGSYLQVGGSSASSVGNWVSNDGIHGLREMYTTATLQAGYHFMEVRYFERTGASENLIVSWSGPGISKQVIPAEVLFKDIYAFVGYEMPSNNSQRMVASQQATPDAEIASLNTKGIKLRQNPVLDGTLKLQAGASQELQEGGVVMVDVSGRKFASRLVQTGDGWEVSTRQLSPGMYILLLQSQDGQQHRLRFVQK